MRAAALAPALAQSAAAGARRGREFFHRARVARRGFRARRGARVFPTAAGGGAAARRRPLSPRSPRNLSRLRRRAVALAAARGEKLGQFLAPLLRACEDRPHALDRTALGGPAAGPP